MNSTNLMGELIGAPHFHWNRLPGQPPQAFMAYLVRLPGPPVEEATVARVVVYGPDAEHWFPRLRAGDVVAVTGRYRVRTNRDAQRELADLQTVDEKLAYLLQKAVQVHEFVVYPHQFRALPPTNGTGAA